MRLFVFALAWAVIVTVGIFGAVSLRKAKFARGNQRALAAEEAERALEIASIQERIRRAKSEEAHLQAAILGPTAKGEKVANANSVATRPSGAMAPAKRPDISALLQASPTLRAAFKQSYRAGLSLGFRPFYDSYALSPEQKDKFEEIATEAEQEKMDLESAAATQGLKANSPQLANMRKEIGDRLQAAQKDVLGEDGFQELQQYQRTENLFPLINMTAALVANTPTPITMPQVEKMTEALANSSTSYQGGGKADVTTVDWDVAGPRIQAVTAPVQYESFKAYAGFVRLTAMVAEFYKQERGPAK